MSPRRASEHARGSHENAATFLPMPSVYASLGNVVDRDPEHESRARRVFLLPGALGSSDYTPLEVADPSSAGKRGTNDVDAHAGPRRQPRCSSRGNRRTVLAVGDVTALAREVAAMRELPLAVQFLGACH